MTPSVASIYEAQGRVYVKVTPDISKLYFVKLEELFLTKPLS